MVVHPKDIIMAVEKHYLSRFKELYKLRYNPSIKGQGLELVMKEFLETYLGSIFDFQNHVALIDYEGKYYQIFSPGENEFDIVATYKTAVPKIAININNFKYILLDAVAFIIETKQDLTAQNLKHDLKKLSNLSLLPIHPKRMSIHMSGKYTINQTYIPKILFYINKKISEKTLSYSLSTYTNAWDFLAIVPVQTEDICSSTLIINPKLGLSKRKNEIIVIKGFALTKLICLLLLILPLPFHVNASSFFFKNLF